MKQHGEWKVTSNPIGGETLCATYRIFDTNKVDHSGNREYATPYVRNRKYCEVVADRLNGKYADCSGLDIDELENLRITLNQFGVWDKEGAE